MRNFGLEIESEENWYENKVFLMIDNLANQIIARCIIVANRLTHGRDIESEKNIMSIAFKHQACWKIPEPKIASEVGSGFEHILWLKAEKVKNGDQALLSRLQDLPYLNPKYKLSKT